MTFEDDLHNYFGSNKDAIRFINASVSKYFVRKDKLVLVKHKIRLGLNRQAWTELDNLLKEVSP